MSFKKIVHFTTFEKSIFASFKTSFKFSITCFVSASISSLIIRLFNGFIACSKFNPIVYFALKQCYCTSNSSLVTVASLDKNKIKNFISKYNFKDLIVCNNYDEVIKNKDIKAIYIATLNNTHFDLIKKCSENNKNILCEKPFTLSYDEGKKVYESVLKNNVNFFEGFAYRSHPQTKIIQEIVENNELGEVTNIKSSFGYKVNKIKPESRIFNKDLGGGAILDIGCYPLSILNLFYKNSNNYKFLNTKGSFTQTNVDDYAEADIEIDNKIKCQIKVSFKENYSNKTIIEGKKGKLIIRWRVDKIKGSPFEYYNHNHSCNMFIGSRGVFFSIINPVK